MHIWKRISALFLVLMLAASMIGHVSADDSDVVYEEDAAEFIFLVGSEYSASDLFHHFKDVMPGDTLTERIIIRNDASKEVKIKVYMRSLGAHEDSIPFLSQLVLHVENQEDTIMFDAAHETGDLTDWICLGTLYSGGEVVLDVTLQVPVTLDNTFEELIGYLDWEFMVEQFPVEPDDPKPPQTGDDNSLLLYGGLMAVSGLLLILLLVPRRKKEEENENQ